MPPLSLFGRKEGRKKGVGIGKKLAIGDDRSVSCRAGARRLILSRAFEWCDVFQVVVIQIQVVSCLEQVSSKATMALGRLSQESATE